MNWHSIGRYFSKNFNNVIIVDFGSTTTDFVCIKNSKIINQGFDDFTRLSKKEIFYSGIIRTPLFGLEHEITLKKKKYQIIPEFFSNTSDIYRIYNFLEKDFDIDDEADNGKKGIVQSMIRISRSFCIEYKKSKRNLILDLSKVLIDKQINNIKLNIYNLLKKNKLDKNTPLIFTGIGKKILEEKIKTKSGVNIGKLIKAQNKKLNNFALNNMPAYCIAQLISDLKK